MIKKIFYSLVLSIISLSVLAAEKNSYKGKDFYLDLNVGMASHDSGVSAVSGTTLDEDDIGYMLNIGRRMSAAWSLEGMYYDMGAASITGSVNDTFVMDGTTYVWNTAGTLSNATSGFGGAIVGYLPTDEWLEVYGKLGVHLWNQSGSATFLDNNSTFNSKFFDEGADFYFGLGITANIIEDLKISVGYDALNFTDEFDPSVDYYTTFLYAGIKYEF